jgi:hypothetical protein
VIIQSFKGNMREQQREIWERSRSLTPLAKGASGFGMTARKRR